MPSSNNMNPRQDRLGGSDQASGRIANLDRQGVPSAARELLCELNRIVAFNYAKFYFAMLFVIIVVVQTRHYQNQAHSRTKLTTFLVENGLVTGGDDGDVSKQVDHFMSYYDCQSVVRCAEQVGGGGTGTGTRRDQWRAVSTLLSGHARFEHVASVDFESDQSPADTSPRSTITPPPGASLHHPPDLEQLFLRLRDELILDQWLQTLPISVATRLKQQYQVRSLREVAWLSAGHQPGSPQFEQLAEEEQQLFGLLHQTLSLDHTEPNSQVDINLARLSQHQWQLCLDSDRKLHWSIGSLLAITLTPWIILELFTMISDFHFAYKEGKCGFLTFITGSYLAPQNCKVIFDWESPTTVSNIVTFSIKFYQRNFKPYPISPEDQLSVHITNGTQVVPCSIEFGDLNPNLANVARVSFSSKKSGNYTINVLVGSTFAHIRGSPFKDIYFKPLTPSPFETLFVNHCSTVVCTAQNLHALIVETRDRFGNLCSLDDEINSEFDASTDFNVTITELVTEKKIDVCYYWQKQNGDNSKVALILVLESSGMYHAVVSYKGSLLKNGDFTIVCLTEAENEIVKKSTSLSSYSKSCYFNARLLPSTSYNSCNENKIMKPKNVVCFISPKQLTIKEYFLKFIPRRIATFRLLPSTKFYFTRNYSMSNTITKNIGDVQVNSSENDGLSSEANSQEFIIIDDGSQAPIELASPQRNIIVAVFTHFLLNRIGGSETFRDKQDFFYAEVRRYHQKNNFIPGKIHLKIYRNHLLESSIKATKSLNTNDWCKKFEIEFVGENGIDWGGLRREWYELLCKALFEPATDDVADNALFMRFKNDKQGLIHPNSNCEHKLSLYEFAGKIVGKSLLDSALGSSCKCLVNARFSRSFLAQLIGLRVNYRYFEQDDPDLYVSKIKFIIENNVSSLDLFFSEEEYDKKTGKLIRTFDLIPNGSNIRVTEENKIRYLDALAQHRLSTCVKDQVEAFLKGLNDLIPDNLLSIFDENEIELLVCGAATYSVSDLRLNHVVTGASYDFQKVVDWFWRSLANFTDEEFARLLQFTTGCSHLPPGGFAELNPRFQISSALTYGTLPTAHTCFNQICLPDYDSYDQFDRALRIAITEGSEGFGLV